MKKFLLLMIALCASSVCFAQTTYNSTSVRVNIGAPTQATFWFPTPSGSVGPTVAFVQCDFGRYFVSTNYGTTSQQRSTAIPLTCEVTHPPDSDGDSNQTTAVVVTSAQSGTVGSQTVTLNSASFSSEQTGMHNQNETLGGSATITIQ